MARITPVKFVAFAHSRWLFFEFKKALNHQTGLVDRFLVWL